MTKHYSIYLLVALLCACTAVPDSIPLDEEAAIWPDYTGGLIWKHRLPSRWADHPEAMSAVTDLVSETLNRLGICNGPAYFQIMMDRRGTPRLIEVTPRLDGCHMWRLIRYSTGVDLLEMTVKAMEGEKAGRTEYSVRPYMTEFLCLPPETVFSKDLFHDRTCDYLEWYYRDGETVRKMNGYKEKCGYRIYEGSMDG